MMSNVDIVTYRDEDYDTLIDLWEKSGLPYKPNGRDSIDSISREIHNGHCRFLFAKRNDEFIGSALITHDGRKGWINRVCVLPDFRYKGIARSLVDAGEIWLKEQGIGIFACQIEGYNDQSYEAFRKMGYVPFEGIRYLTKRVHPDI